MNAYPDDWRQIADKELSRMTSEVRHQLLEKQKAINKELRELRITFCHARQRASVTGHYEDFSGFHQANRRLVWLKEESQRLQIEIGKTKPKRSFPSYFMTIAESELPAQQFSDLVEKAKKLEDSELDV